jgi:membrane-bound lysozyme inhibitor of c-type lysozyme MliC
MKLGRLKEFLPFLFAFGLVAPAQAQTYYHYECADGAHFEVTFYPDTKFAFLQFDGKSLQLPKRFSLTSQRFAKNGVSFSMKAGGKATIKRLGKTSQCQVN